MKLGASWSKIGAIILGQTGQKKRTLCFYEGWHGPCPPSSTAAGMSGHNVGEFVIGMRNTA